jgi:ribA/ribD-fused uncharacterized protein
MHQFSNPIPFEIDGESFPCYTTEMFYLLHKTKDKSWQRKIYEAVPIGKAKRLSKQAPLRDDWDDIRQAVMWKALNWKFRNNEYLKQKLLDTGEAYLVEENWWEDDYWGFCLKTEKGQNILGRMLMALRKKLREEQKDVQG